MSQPVKEKKRRGPKLTELKVTAEQAIKYGIEPLPELKGLDRFLTPNQAGRLLNVTGEAVKQWIYRGRLPATKQSNGYWMIRAADLESFINARQSYDRKRVLLFCTNDGDRDVLCEVLGESGHEPVHAHNFTDALLKTADLKPSAFVIQTNLPGGTCWRFLERVRSMEHVRGTAVLLLAPGQLSETEEQRALDLRVQGILRTPLDAKQTTNYLGQAFETMR
jgi:CheY-like chemotaxis protein